MLNRMDDFVTIHNLCYQLSFLSGAVPISAVRCAVM